jgi:hypothetical protein
MVDPRLRMAVDESACWYDELCALHGIGCGIHAGLWFSSGPPPPLHSAAKSIEPTVTAEQALRSVADQDHCSIADSFGTLELEPEMDLLIQARWLHRPPLDSPPTGMPGGWAPVRSADALAEWTTGHGTAEVLLPAILRRSSFSVLGRRDDNALTAGAVTHLCGGVVSVSNVWAAPGHETDWAELVRLVHAVHPGRAVVGYEQGEELARAQDAGFTDVGPQLVWFR